MKRIEIDWTRCDGHGLCAELLPEVITLDEWGFPVIRKVTFHDSDKNVRRAVAACPALALRLEKVVAARPSAPNGPRIR